MHNIVLIKIISKHNFLINDKGQWQSPDFHRESKEPNERISIKYSKIKYHCNDMWYHSQGSNDINETLLKKINGAGNIHLVPSKINDMYFLRFAVCSRYSESKDIQNSWKEIKLRADEVLEEQSVSKWWRAQIARGCRSLTPATCNQS